MVPKALAELDGERLVDRAVRILSLGGADPVLVVLGAAVVDVPGADAVVVNGDWAEGMGSSLRAGLTAPELAGCGAVVVLLVDQPGIRPTAVRRLLAAYDDGADLAVATYEAERGHPVLIGRTHWAGVVAAAVGDVGARAYLTGRREAVREVACDGDARDADTPAELSGRGTSAGSPGRPALRAMPLAMGLGELGPCSGRRGAGRLREGRYRTDPPSTRVASESDPPPVPASERVRGRRRLGRPWAHRGPRGPPCR